MMPTHKPSDDNPVDVLTFMGRRVALDNLKDALELAGVEQADLADRADCSPGYISKVLNGKRAPNATVQGVVVEFVEDHGYEWDQLAPSGSVDSHAEALSDQITDAGENADVPFPLEKAQEVARLCRKGAEENEVSMTFSLRKLIKWGRSFHIFREDADLGARDALAASFWMSAVYAADDEARRFVLEMYQRVFGMDAEEPISVIDHDDDQHPAEPIVELFARRGFPVYAFGPTGCGKTYAAKRVSRRLTSDSVNPFFRFQGDPNKHVDDFVGSYAADSTEDGGTRTYWEPGPLPQAMAEGRPLILDEPEACDPGVLMALQGVLEGDGLYVTKGGGQVIYPQDGFNVIACGNTRGLGEAVEYVGTNVLNEAFRDRFMFVEFEYMPAKQELGIAASEIESWEDGTPTPAEGASMTAESDTDSADGDSNESEDENDGSYLDPMRWSK